MRVILSLRLALVSLNKPQIVFTMSYMYYLIKESVDSLCKDGTGTSIVRVQRKAVRAGECLCSEHLAMLSKIFCPSVPPKLPKPISRLTARKQQDQHILLLLLA